MVQQIVGMGIHSERLSKSHSADVWLPPKIADRSATLAYGPEEVHHVSSHPENASPVQLALRGLSSQALDVSPYSLGVTSAMRGSGIRAASGPDALSEDMGVTEEELTQFMPACRAES